MSACEPNARSIQTTDRSPLHRQMVMRAERSPARRCRYLVRLRSQYAGCLRRLISRLLAPGPVLRDCCEVPLSGSSIGSRRRPRLLFHANGRQVTAITNKLPVKVILLTSARRNSSSRRPAIPEYSGEPARIDFVAVAKALCADSFCCQRSEENTLGDPGGAD